MKCYPSRHGADIYIIYIQLFTQNVQNALMLCRLMYTASGVVGYFTMILLHCTPQMCVRWVVLLFRAPYYCKKESAMFVLLAATRFSIPSEHAHLHFSYHEPRCTSAVVCTSSAAH